MADDDGRPVLSDARARSLAGYWHDEGAPSTPLSLLASDGRITLATVDELRFHLRRLESATEGEEPSAAAAQLRALLGYVIDRGPRGPVPGWDRLHDRVRFRDDVSVPPPEGSSVSRDPSLPMDPSAGTTAARSDGPA